MHVHVFGHIVFEVWSFKSESYAEKLHSQCPLFCVCVL